MAGVVVLEDQNAANIAEGVPVLELAMITKTGTRSLSKKEQRAAYVKKNKVFNPIILKKNHGITTATIAWPQS